MTPNTSAKASGGHVSVHGRVCGEIRVNLEASKGLRKELELYRQGKG